jgi:prepilin-type N-terminal cleavage/methylation domain-containing protein
MAAAESLCVRRFGDTQRAVALNLARMSPPLQSRRGVTVVEVLVALVVLSIAALGSAATIGLSATMQHRAASLRRALEAVRLQATILEALPCTDLADEAAVVNGIAVRWRVRSAESHAAVALTADHRGATAVLRTEVSCE